MTGGAFTSVSGTYELVSSEGYEKYLESIEVNASTRAVLAADPQTVKIVQEGDVYTLRSAVAAKEFVLRFTSARSSSRTSGTATIAGPRG
ncbi:hypothetical protein [Streptomyces sp. NPDC002853]